MSSVKTAISLDERLLDRIDRAAQELELPRSRLLALAAEEFLRRRQTEEMVSALNRVYGQDDGAEEREVRRHHRAGHRRLVEGEW